MEMKKPMLICSEVANDCDGNTGVFISGLAADGSSGRVFVRGDYVDLLAVQIKQQIKQAMSEANLSDKTKPPSQGGNPRVASNNLEQL